MIPAPPAGFVVRRSILYLSLGAAPVKVLEYDEGRIAACFDVDAPAADRVSYGPTESTVPSGSYSNALYNDVLWFYGVDELWAANDGDASAPTLLWITTYRYERSRR